jgi:hypothetical protein
MNVSTVFESSRHEVHSFARYFLYILYISVFSLYLESRATLGISARDLI